MKPEKQEVVSSQAEGDMKPNGSGGEGKLGTGTAIENVWKQLKNQKTKAEIGTQRSQITKKEEYLNVIADYDELVEI